MMDQRIGQCLTFIIVIIILDQASGLSRQCFSCRSRGEKGLCKDSFPFNETTAVGHRGIKVVPCPSGWCSKIIEGVRGPQDDYGTATERACLQLAPSDREERCAELKLNNKPSLICFCRGNLCNSAHSVPSSTRLLISSILLPIFILLYQNVAVVIS